jgi:uncharacterized protein YjbI with pentapeptide repeats
VTNPKLILIAVVTATVLLLFVICLLWWELPKWQVSHLALEVMDAKARADVEDNFRKTVGQALGGAAVLIGAAFALFQFLHHQKEAQEQRQTAQNQFSQQQKAAHDLLISNQVSKGFEQLASEKLAMRLGGIYALEGVMNTSEQYHGSVLEALCAFVRETTPDLGPSDAPIKTATDAQAALTVIGRRAMRVEGTERIDLAKVNINRCNLTDARLHGANLYYANLHYADLSRANLTDADLSRAKLADANLTIARLTGAFLTDARLTGALLNGANLSRANLTGAHLDRADLTGADLSGTNLSRANLTGALNLTQEQLDQACGNADTKLPEGFTVIREDRRD